ncbi:MAG TPA: mechanosensitive ion channel family protein [Gemmatimonadota bacterium]|nr:mechanosensitive ion channel family protein [Gemmatimonadota bacterium]
MIEVGDLTRWILPAALFVGGCVLGVLSETILVARLRKKARQTGWRWDEAVMDSLRGMTFVWFASAGAYGALLSVSQLGSGLETTIRKALVAIVFLSLTVVAARASARGVEMWARRKSGGVPSTSLLQNVARILVFVLGLFLVLQNLGIEVTPLVTGLGIGGLAVALALQDTLSNLFSGFQIILARQVRSGDFVLLSSGEEGYVTDIQWRNTTIRSRIDDHEIIVPNATLANSILTNYARPAHPYWVRVEVGVAYDSDLQQVEDVTLEVASEVLEELEVGYGDDEPIVRYQAFGDSSIGFVVRMRVKDWGEQFRVRHAFIKRLHARYGEEGIEIPFPIRTLYAPRGFRVRGEDPPTPEGGGAEGAGDV